MLCCFESSTALTQLPPLKQRALLPPTVSVFWPRARPRLHLKQSAHISQVGSQKCQVLSHCQSPSSPPWELKGRCLRSRVRQGLVPPPPSSQRRGFDHSLCLLPPTCKHTLGFADGKIVRKEGERREKEEGGCT